MQGEMGNCWFLTGLANLTLNQKLFNYVVPEDQSFKEKYAGVFHFRIWQFGKWIDVVVDDRLPTGKRGEGLLYVKSSEQREFWSSLLEKAYAKIYGSYEATMSGCNSESLEDLTGGIAEEFRLSAAPATFYETLLKAHKHSALLSCAVRKDNTMGLPSCHTYSLTSVKMLDETVKLVRVRNPWGEKTEWTGKWSDDSKEWERVPKYVREEVGLVKAADGEFWMEYADFVQYFEEVTICLPNPFCLGQDVDGDGKKKCRPYKLVSFMGAWTRGVTAGGNISQETFTRNPQYIITLKETDDGNSDKCTLVIGLMQKNRRSQFHLGKSNLVIGFYIFKLEKPDKHPRPLTRDALNLKSLVASTSMRKVREVTHRCSLLPGTYVIVPATRDRDTFGRFMLRVFSEKPCTLRNNQEKSEICRANWKVFGSHLAITSAVGSNVQKESEDGKTRERIFREECGRNGDADWSQLLRILRKTVRGDVSNNFTKATVRTMIGALDTSKCGRIDFEEFTVLLRVIDSLTTLFGRYDQSASGYVSVPDLREMLKGSGYVLGNRILSAVDAAYATRDGRIDLDDYITVSLKLKTVMGYATEGDDVCSSSSSTSSSSDDAELNSVYEKEWFQMLLTV